MCIAPILVKSLLDLAKDKIKITIGNDKNIIEIFNELGVIHQVTSKEQIIFDEKNKIISTAAYMLDNNLVNIDLALNKLIKKAMQLV